MRHKFPRTTLVLTGLALSALALAGGTAAAKDGASTARAPIFCCSE